MYKWPLIHFNGPLLKAKADRYRLFIGYLWLAPFHRRGSFICSIYLPPRLGIGSSRVGSSRGERSQETLNQKRNEEDSVWGITVDLCGCASGIKWSKWAETSRGRFLFPLRNIEIKVTSFKTCLKRRYISKRCCPNRTTDHRFNNSLNNRNNFGRRWETVTNFQPKKKKKKKKKGNRRFSISIRLLINPESMRVSLISRTL